MLRDNDVGQVDLVNIILVVVIAGVVMYAGLLLLSSTAQNTGADEATDVRQVSDEHVAIADSGVWVSVADDDYIGRNPTVTNSLGNAGSFSGDSGVEASVSEPLFDSDGNWTVSQTARINSTAVGENMMLFTAGSPTAALAYNGSRSEWVGFYIQSDSITAVNATATDPENLTTVTLVKNASQLTIYEGGSAGESDDFAGEDVDMTSYGNLTGALDESKVAARAATSSQASSLAADPVTPTFERGDMEARIMWDQQQGAFPVYFAGGTVDSVERTSGAAGSVMDRAGTLSANDYRWKSEGPQILATDSGRLSEHPAVWVTFDGEPVNSYSELTDGLDSAYSTITTVFSVLVLIIIVGYLKLLQSR